MSAPLIAELRQRWPGMRLTIQTGLPRWFLETRYTDFDLVPEIPDFGFKMISSTEIDLPASAAAYGELHADFGAIVEREAARLAAARPDLVIANVPYALCAAAHRAGVPVMAFSSLNWADMFAHYLRGIPDAARIESEIRDAYAKAAVFVRCTPAQRMTLPNLRDVGPVARLGRARRADLAAALGAGEGTRIGLIAFGGIDHRLPMAEWPVVPGWTWVHTVPGAPARPDLRWWEDVPLLFADLIPSVDVLVTKPGYGTFTEAGLAGTPTLYLPRPGWPECPYIDDWLAQHTRALPVASERLFEPGLDLLLQRLLELPERGKARASGVGEAADVVDALIAGNFVCERS